MSILVHQPYTGDPYIDWAFYDRDSNKWPAGTLTFSFPQTRGNYPLFYFAANLSGFHPVTAEQQEAVRAILTGHTLNPTSQCHACHLVAELYH
jgi:hypothetical protein